MTTSDPFGLLDPAVRANPYPVFARLRNEAPVYFSEGWNSWLVTRYADVVACFRDPRLSANRSAGYAQKLPPAALEKLRPLIRNLSSWSLLIDPPEHTRLRGLIAKAFTPRLIEGLRPRIEALVADLLEEMASTPRVDLLPAFANLLPVIVIGDMMGLPRDDWHELKRWSDAIAGFFGATPLTMEAAGRALAAVVEQEEYFRGKIAERRATPGDDLLSQLIAAEEKGAFLNEGELLSTCSMTIFGGHETTTNLIANAVYTLARHPDERAKLFTAPDSVATMVEEILRYEGSVARMGRVAKEDVEVGGQTIKKGDRAFLVLASANRDAAQFTDAERLDILRRENKHVAFGIGPHFCIGATLGRMEAQIALGGLFQRFPSLRLAGREPRWIENLSVRGLESLEVELA